MQEMNSETRTTEVMNSDTRTTEEINSQMRTMKEMKSKMKIMQMQQKMQLERQHVKHMIDKKNWWEDTCAKNDRSEYLEANNLVLKEQVDTAKIKIEELEQKVAELDFELKTNAKTSAILQESSYYERQSLSTNLTKCERELVAVLEHYEKTLSDLKENHDNTVSSMTIQFQKRLKHIEDERDRVFQEQETKYQSQVEKLKKDINEWEKRHKHTTETLNAKLEKTIADYELKTRRLCNGREADKEKHRAEVFELNFFMKDKDAKIKALENRPDLTPQILAAQETICSKSEIIRLKNRDIQTLHKEIRDAQKNFGDQKNINAIMEASLDELKATHKALEQDMQNQRKINKKLKAEEVKNKHKITCLNDAIERLKYKLVASSENTKLKNKIQDLETQQLRLKEAVQSCIQVMNEPKALRKALIATKRRYIDGDERVEMREHTRLGYKSLADGLRVKLKHSEDIRKAQESHIKICESTIQDNAIKAHQQRVTFLNLFNEKKAKVRTWISKKNGKVVPMDTNVPPNSPLP
ncbi:hypothetical protein PAMA_001920 [Pampus argenteus]